MTTATEVSAARFALDEEKAREWIGHAIAAYEGTEGEALPEAYLPALGEDYAPRDCENSGATGELVANARLAGIITGPGEVDWDFSYDQYGDHGYTWRLLTGSRCLTLSSGYEDLRHLGERKAKGAGAALSVLREAVDSANCLLGSLSRYVAALPLAVRAPEIAALVAQLPRGEWGADELGVLEEWLTRCGYDVSGDDVSGDDAS